MIFTSDASIDGELVYGHGGWHWSKNKGRYQNGRDFFWIHWEISERAPDTVKLHVESPNADTDSALNAIKREVVQEFLSARFKNAIERQGYAYKPGNRIKPEHMERYKCTAPFHVVLSAEQQQTTDEQNIELVNAIVADELSAVIYQLRPQLAKHFP